MQRAVFVREVGKPLVVDDRSIPKPKNKDILIKVHSTMLLPHDTYSRDLGLFVADKLPYVLGTNIAGTIQAVGPNVRHFQVGDHVFGIGDPLSPHPDYSGLQQYALLIEGGAAKIPKNLSFEEASSLPVNAVTSAAALFHPRGLSLAPPFPVAESDPNNDMSANAKRSIVIIGGGSNVGKLAIQFARIAGVGTIIAVASAKNDTHLRQLGATHVIDRYLDKEAIESQVSDVLDNGGGALAVYDCVSWDFALAISLISRTKPSILACLHPVESTVELVKKHALPVRVQFIRGTVDFLQPLSTGFWTSFPKWLESGRIWIPTYRTVNGLDLDVIENALDSYRDGTSVVPLVVRPNH